MFTGDRARNPGPNAHQLRNSGVAITGFGKFSVAKRGARNGRNPATGQAIKIKASKTPKFTAGQTLKSTVAGKKKT